MKIYKDESLTEFEFWSGAKDIAKHLTDDELDRIESILEEQYPEGMGETELNEFFWFKEDLIAEWLGYPEFEALYDWELDCEDEDEA